MANGNRINAAGVVVALPVLIGLGVAGFDLGSEPRPTDATAEVAPDQVETFLSTLSATERSVIETHVFGGLPSVDNVHVQQGYVRSYDSVNRVPRWVAYKVDTSFLNTPPRAGRFKSFRTDPDLENPVRDDDYTGLHGSRGYARGHLAPFAVMGGDRNGNEILAPDDDFDNETVFQSNFMSNIAPQHHGAFNGAGGMWFALERFIQETAVRDGGVNVSVFAGTVFGYGAHERVGPNSDIGVAPMFFKIVIRESEGEDDDLPVVLAFLFPHHRTRHGEISDYLTSVDVIEGLTGLNFFNEFGPEVQHALEDPDTFDNWDDFLLSANG